MREPRARLARNRFPANVAAALYANVACHFCHKVAAICLPCRLHKAQYKNRGEPAQSAAVPVHALTYMAGQAVRVRVSNVWQLLSTDEDAKGAAKLGSRCFGGLTNCLSDVHVLGDVT